MEITINWNAFLLVFAAALGFSSLIVACFSLGVRLMTDAQSIASKARKGNRKAQQREALFLIGSYLTFSICVIALGFGIYLIVPFFPH